MKTCTKCGKENPATTEFFHRDRTKSDGLRPRCKKCACVDARQYHHKYYALHPERVRETQRKYWHKYYALHSKKLLEVQRCYRVANRAKTNANYRKWRAANPERARAIVHRRRARKFAAGGSYTAEDINKLYDLQKGKCWWCGKKFKNGKYHIDHRIPLAKGGSNDIANIVLAHPSCNMSKGAKMPDEFAGRLL